MDVLTSILLICAAGLTLAWLVAAQRRLVAHLARRFLAMPRFEQSLVVFAVCILTVCAQKQRTENSEQLTDGVASASGSVISHGGTCTVETRSVSEGRFGEAEPEGRASVCETRSGEIIEWSNNRIIESVVASASGSDDSRRAAENAEIGTAAPQAEEESLSNRNSIIRTFDYSIIDSQVSATSDTSVLRAKTTLTTNDIARSYALVETRTNGMVSFEMPTNGVEVGTWGRTGAYRDVVRVELDFSHGVTCTVETRSVSEGRFGEAEPEGRASVCEARSGEIIEWSNNRIIESAEASASGSVISHGVTCTVETRSVSEGRFGEAEPEGRASVCETRSGEIIEWSNNRIIESAEASASGSDDSRRAAENAEVETVAPQAEEESLSNHNSIIQTFDYSIIHPFPLGDSIVTSLWVHTWGKVRPRIRDRAHEIVAVGTPMSVIAGEGRLWTAATTNGTWLITWEKFREGRVKRAIIESSNNRIIELAEASASGSDDSRRAAANAEVETVAPQAEEESLSNRNSIIRQFDYSIIGSISAQIELFPNGDFITRSNNVERVYRRINPDDWDDDGIENDEDDEPMIAAVEMQFGPHQTLPEDANSNAYCWVDVVVPQANAKVTFAGDGASNLADPSFIAKAGETHRVAILIGKTYCVTCPLPFRIAAKSSDEISEVWNGANEVELCWPISVDACVTDGDSAFDAQCAAIRQIQVVDASNYTLSPLMTLAATADANATTPTTHSQSFVMSVVPSGLGGLFNWTRHCCSISGTGYAFEQTCRGKCGCGGCSTEGIFNYEGYQLSVYGPSCPCMGEPDDDDDDNDDDEAEDPPASGVSAYFTKSVIFFEDEYDNTPTEHVGWQSTETVLCCLASGGKKGGLVRIEIEGAENLLQYGGQPLPFEQSLAAGESVSFKNTYRAVKESGASNDIKVRATFVENETEWSQETTDEATAVRVEIMAESLAPANSSFERHKYGVNEISNIRFFPRSASVFWNVEAGNLAGETYRCPLAAQENPLGISGGGAEYVPEIEIVEPLTVLVISPDFDDFDAPIGEAGSIAMRLPLYIGPFDVDFSELAVEEVPNEQGSAIGYFARNDLSLWKSHTRENGAGLWFDVTAGNKMGGPEVYDQAGVTDILPRVNSSGLFVDDPNCKWAYGQIVMPNPFGWNVVGTAADSSPVKQFAENTRDIIELNEEGRCRIWKLDNEAIRHVDGSVYLNGEKVK